MSEDLHRLPALGELIRDPPPVIAHFLDAAAGPYQTWFETDAEGELLRGKALEAFKRASERESLAPLMPLMAHTPKREGTAPHHATGSPGAAFLFGGFERNLNPNSDLIAPIWLGERVRVRLAAKLVGPILAGDRVRFSANSGVIRSVIGPGTYIDDGANLKDSLVGSDCYLGVGAKLLSRESGRRSDTPITFTHGSVVTIPRLKMGCVIGDGCRIGAGSILMPGTVLMPGTIIPEDTGKLPVGIYAQADINRFLSGR